MFDTLPRCSIEVLVNLNYSATPRPAIMHKRTPLRSFVFPFHVIVH